MQLRSSSYVVQVETHDDDQVILVHGYTKAIDLVSRRVADLLADPARPVDQEALGEQNVRALVRRGHLTEKSVEDEREGFVKLVTLLDQHKRRATRPGFVLMPTYLCNLNCFYCYQKPAIEADEELVKHLMSKELADKAFSAYEAMLPEGQTIKGGDLLLYGGEPLLRSSRDLVLHVVERCRREEMSIRAISNGTQLHHYTDVLGPTGIGWMQITLDGARHEHDTRRITRGGKGTFDQIVDNIGVALECGVTVSVRLNLDRRNIASLEELNGLFERKGFYAHPRFSTYAAELHMIDEQEPWVERSDLVHGMDITAAITERGYAIGTSQNTAFSHLVEAVSGQGFQNFKTGFCGANFGMCIFDAKGNVYSCWDEVELFEPVGHYREGRVVYNEELRRAWQRSPILANPLCHDCAYAFFCGGGCDWHGKKEGQAYYDQYCPDYMRSFRAGVAEDYAVAKLAVEKGMAGKDEHGRVRLTSEQRAEILKEVGAKLRSKNLTACGISCGKAKAPEDGARLHEKRTAANKRALAVIMG
jgi:uncharacterized protein